MTEKFRRVIGKWRCFSYCLIALVLALIITLVVVVVWKDKEIKELVKSRCGANHESQIDTEIPEPPTVFNDLTKKEMAAILEYLYSQEALNLKKPEDADLNTSFLYSADYVIPDKKTVLNYLDNGGVTPKRKAKVVLFRGDLRPPVIEEYEVGPLPEPTTHKLINSGTKRNRVQYSFRPNSMYDYRSIDNIVLKQVDKQIGDILVDLYGAKFSECGNKCLKYVPSFISSGITHTHDRLAWLWLYHGVEYFTLHPLDMAILVNLTSNQPSEHQAIRVSYLDKVFNSLEIFRNEYQRPKLFEPRIPFPTAEDEEFASLKMRGDPKPENPQRMPLQVEPDGKRYSIKGRYIEYLGWGFNFKISTQTGPQLFDVKYDGERIAYEISLQETSAFHSGSTPQVRFAKFIDGVKLLGLGTKTLVAGSDCPEYATFLETSFLVEGSEEPVTFKHGACIFEQNTGIPLRRHSAYSGRKGQRFYGGMTDTVLIVRSIVTVGNYDYVIDFIFHQGGALETSITPTGYLSSTCFTDRETAYGFPIHGRIMGNIHNHLVHFKVDLDIKGTQNSFETLDIDVEAVRNEPWSERQYQSKFIRTVKTSERDAVYKYDFDTPKYLLFHNPSKQTDRGVPRAYRIQPVGVSKQLLPEDEGDEPSVSWSRYQLAVTRYKDEEITSSSPYASFDALEPVLKFQDYIDDNENIVEEDLVAWVSLGSTHIPHTEDIPLTTTVGGQLKFFLLPYNYFEEDASMSSRDAVYIELKNPEDVGEGLEIERYGRQEYSQCVPQKTYFDETVQEDPSIVLNTKDSSGHV